MARAIAAKAVVEHERQGTVLVRAIPPSGRLNDARPVCGFDGRRRRYAGETFLISEAKEFSPRWMEFVDRAGNVIDPPAEWQAVIQARESALAQQIEQGRRENAQSVQQKQVANLVSMFQLQAQNVSSHFNSDGQVVRNVDPAVVALAEENAQLKALLEKATAPDKKK